MHVSSRLSERHIHKMSVVDFMQRSEEIFRAAGTTFWKPQDNKAMLRWLDQLGWHAKHDLDDGYKRLFEHWLKDYVETLIWMQGEYERLRAADPGGFYTAAHDVALDFHKSGALWRFFCAGNRCSKTQSGYQDDYWVVTNQHPYRDIPFRNQAVAIVGTTYQKYSKDVFDVKMVTGETGNELSPYFPEGGKWLHRYDRKSYRITVACPECANDNRAANCSPLHKGRGTVSLYSDDGGARAIMGAQFGQLHLDEHVDEEFFREGTQRLSTVSHSGGIITGSPLYGPDVWEHRIVEQRAKMPKEQNLRFPSQPDGPGWAAYFNISQIDAGLRPVESIEADAVTMPRHEYKARVLGIPTAIADAPVFDPKAIEHWEDAAADETWRKGRLDCSLTDLAELNDIGPLAWTEDGVGSLEVLEEPTMDGQYVIGVDTAAGLGVDTGASTAKSADFSCASVFNLRIENKQIHMRKVAEWHGYLRPGLFAEEVKKLGIWYNGAWLVIETTGGLGAAVLERLKHHIFYPKIFVDKSKPTQIHLNPLAKFGVDTNVNTKPLMVAAMQHMLASRRLEVPHLPTTSEMTAFTQLIPENGRYIRYEAAPGAKDDRVMACAMACYAVQNNPYLWSWEKTQDGTPEDRRLLPEMTKDLQETHWAEDVEKHEYGWNLYEN